MRRIAAVYLILLASQWAAGVLLATQRGLILSDPSSVRVDWTRSWGGAYRDYAYDAVYAGGALFVTGATISYGPGSLNLALLKYDDGGALVWNATYSSGGYSMGRGIASDGGSLYVSGIHTEENASYSLLLKYDFDGRLIWSREWREGFDARSSGVALDGRGNIYVVGYVTRAPLDNREYLLKYDGDGNLLFSKAFDSDRPEVAWGVSVGDAVYICGEVSYDIRKPGAAGEPATKMLLRKVGLDGTLLWEEEYYTGVNNVANAVDAGSDIIVAGYVRYANVTAREMLLRYSTRGKLLSASTFGESPIEDMAWGVARAGDFVYVAGHAWPNILLDTADASVYKLGSGNELIWRDYFGGMSVDRARAVAINGDAVYVVGETYWEGLDMQVVVKKYISPNATLGPELSQALILSPFAIGSLLLATTIYAFKPRKKTAKL